MMARKQLATYLRRSAPIILVSIVLAMAGLCFASDALAPPEAQALTGILQRTGNQTSAFLD